MLGTSTIISYCCFRRHGNAAARATICQILFEFCISPESSYLMHDLLILTRLPLSRNSLSLELKTRSHLNCKLAKLKLGQILSWQVIPLRRSVELVIESRKLVHLVSVRGSLSAVNQWLVRYTSIVNQWLVRYTSIVN